MFSILCIYFSLKKIKKKVDSFLDYYLFDEDLVDKFYLLSSGRILDVKILFRSFLMLYFFVIFIERELIEAFFKISILSKRSINYRVIN